MLLMFLSVVINLSHQQHYTVITVTHHTKSLLRAAQSGSEDGSFIFPHPSFLCDTFPSFIALNFLSRCAV